MTTNETRKTIERLRSVLIDIGVPRQDAMSAPPDQDLQKVGLLDSIGVIGLALRVEKEFGLRLKLGIMDPENFSTLRGLARLVETQQGRAGRPPQ